VRPAWRRHRPKSTLEPSELKSSGDLPAANPRRGEVRVTGIGDRPADQAPQATEPQRTRCQA
jgi:hypothetical protein